MLIAIETKESKAIQLNSFSLGSAVVMTLKGIAQLIAFGIVGYVGYALFSGPIAPAMQAVEMMICK